MRAGFVVGTLNPSTAGSSTGFIPDPGFSFSVPGGTPAFDQPFTIIVADSRFGPNGPNLAFFDDFRGRTIGGTLGGTAPVAGFVTYPASQTSNPIFRGVNRSGNGPGIAVLDNEAPGAAGAPFGRTININMGQTYQSTYSFWAESWDSTWDGRNDNGAGGGYYKMQWNHGTVNDYGATSADSATPLFLELISGNAAISSITWNAGVVTVNTTGTFGFAPGYGPTWRVTMGSGHSSGGTDQVPAAYAGDFTATQTGPNQFTYPLAANPGPCTTLGTFAPPGSIQGMNVPANNINTGAFGNSSSPNISLWFARGDSNGIQKWDTASWNSLETLQLADPTDPVNNFGNVYMALYNSPNKQAYAINDNTRYKWSSNPAFNSFQFLSLCGLIQNTGPNPHTARRADYYVAIGPNCAKRFFIGDASTLANCTTIMPCTINSWSSNSVTMTLRQGSFTAPTGNHLYWADVANNISHVGQFGTAATFDFYISTTGSNSNPGTLASPWAMTAINSKGATYAGKRVGILPGTYPCSALMSTNESVAAFTITGGSVSAQTYIASCDASGNYSRGTATIQANDNGIHGGGNTFTSPIMAGRAGNNYWTVDGLVFTGFSLWAFHVGNSPSGGAEVINGTVQNCEFTGGSCATSTVTSGVNCGPIIVYAATNFTCTNNYIHDNTMGGAPDTSHFSAVYQWGLGISGKTSGSTYTYNTIVNSGGLHGKEGGNQGTTIAYNYIDWSTGPLGQNGSAIQGFDGYSAAGLSQASSFHHNVLISTYIPLDLQSELGGGGWTTALSIYNNTIIMSGGSTAAAIDWYENTAGTRLLTKYNNLYSGTVGGYGWFLGNLDAFAISDYEIYGSTLKWTSVPNGGHGSGGAVTYTTLASMRTAFGTDAHSSNNSTNPFTNAGTYAKQYTVTAGVAFGTGKTGGTSGGSSVNVGAWDGIVTQIGASWVS